MPLASVKKRSSGLVISVSISCGGMPRIERRHHDFRQIDRREQIHRHPREAGDADDRQRQADDDDEVRIANGKAGHG